ncbi:6-phosphofructokinase [Magnetospira sp. QH-2]|uniref:6-phosphofructokinase n=1 Tax=Magnetospira sp. (strain QH-2) TaxID=1288970 RepID=UPI0003E8125F|nr:6-phosphofructokinase [Magnetospira sp. QH-2]CCQ73028.1 6-phosphofructokinase [Magnetospira sp. QH-2]
MLKGKVLVAQGGGPTAVINQSMVGVVQEARKIPSVERVYGALHGVSGIVNENFVDLTQETDANLEMVAATPSSALGSTRDKPDLEYCKNIFKVCQAHGIESFFYCGGNDSSDTCRIVAEEAEKVNYNLRCVHVPKTIDNDLVINDHTPGFPSAARYVASAFAGLNLDNKALPGVFLGIVMGRHAGFMTAAAAGLTQNSADGPHLIYLPERTFDMDSFVTDVKTTYDKYGRCVIAVSEGIHDASGNPIITQLMSEIEKDAHGNVQLSGTGALGDLLSDAVKEKTGIKRVRADTLGYMQRSFLGCVSDVDQREARQVGQRAVNFAHYLDKSGTVTIRRVGEYRVDFVLDKLTDVAAKTKVMPDEFINAAGNGVTEDFMRYIKPLLGSDITPVAYLSDQNKVDKIIG